MRIPGVTATLLALLVQAGENGSSAFAPVSQCSQFGSVSCTSHRGGRVNTMKMIVTDNASRSHSSKKNGSSSLFGKGGLFSSRRSVTTSGSDALGSFSGTALSVSAVSGGVESPKEDKPYNPGPSLPLGSSGVKINIYGFFYLLVALSLGVFWWTGNTICQLLYSVFGGKFDPNRRVPVTIGHIWGKLTMLLTGNSPVIEGRENLAPLYDANKGKKRNEMKPVMFVANHASWMDIPYVGMAIGWKNYKIIAKKELLKVPFLSKSIRVGGHVVLDRGNRRSQLETFKKGIHWLKNGVNLVTFAEGTRSKDGRLMPFKAGAFKIAEHVGAPIVPVSICHAHEVQPIDYAFPIRPSRSIPAKVCIGKPISTQDKSDEEVMKEVWNAVAENLPESQKPKPGTPASRGKAT